MNNETPTPEAGQPAADRSEDTTHPDTAAVSPPEQSEPEQAAPEQTAPEGEATGEQGEPEGEAAPEVASDAEAAPEVESEAQAEPEAEAAEPEAAVAEPAADAVEPAAEAEVEPEVAEPTPEPSTPTPAPPKPAAPSPAALAARIAAARPTMPAATPDPSESARFGRVGEDGTVYVVRGEQEQAVGSYPGASADEALQYFARKYDELFGMADLLEQRLHTASELTARDAAEQLSHLAEQMTEPAFVGDLDALQAKLDSIAAAVETRREEETAARAAAKAAALTEREALVARAEAIAAQDPRRIQWKRSGEELRSIFEEWKAHQRSGAKLDKPVEAELWTRFSSARTAFDKARRAHFAELETTQSEAKTIKEGLVREAELLSTSKDWGPTAREFKRLMDRWRAAGRAGRADDDKLWERFKTAQDTFFNAKDEVAAAEDEVFRGNLAVKEELLVEANALLPISNLEDAKAALRSIQDRWDKAGKVPRADLERTEKALRRVEQAVREADEKKWSSSNPEALARAQSLVDQLEKAVAGLEQDLAAAEAKGNEKKVAEARAALEARQGWLDQARAALTEFS
ncbi:MAG TPA: DUF349 domain-containing protein [Intrasporangiaceae bacterium]|nr:DUF349 domain-containing protein [Intrasporangiaceae bacterium]